MVTTFKQYLINEYESEKGETADALVFNTHEFLPRLEKVLALLMKSASAPNTPWAGMHELVLIEALSTTKEVIYERLEPFRKDANYQERQGKGAEDMLTESIIEQIRETLVFQFKEIKPAINKFVDLIAAPIVEEIQKVGPVKAAKVVKPPFTQEAQDAFGRMMRFVVNSVIVPHADDAKVAQTQLLKWAKEARQRRAGTVKRQQRLTAMKKAMASTKKVEDEDSDK